MKYLSLYLTVLILSGCVAYDTEGPCSGPRPEICMDFVVGKAYLIDSTEAWLPDTLADQLNFYDSNGVAVSYKTKGIKIQDKGAQVSSSTVHDDCGGVKTCYDYIETNAQEITYTNNTGAYISWITIYRDKRFTRPVRSDKTYLDSLEDLIVVRFLPDDLTQPLLDFDIQKDGIFLESVTLNNITFKNVFEVISGNTYLYYNYERGIIGFKYKGKLRTIH